MEYPITWCNQFIGRQVSIDGYSGVLESYSIVWWKDQEYYDLVFLDDNGSRKNSTFSWKSKIRVGPE